MRPPRSQSTDAAGATPAVVHRLALTLAGATLALIFVGGLVTSTGSGLAVPDWPLSFGQVFPRMVGGVLYEHGHRMAAATVGALTVALALVTFLVEAPLRVRRLALLAVATVIAQGLLGGLTVLLLLPPAVSMAHACLAQAFLCLTVAMAVVSGPRWSTAQPPFGDRALARLTAATAGVVYCQLIVGALVRHTGAGLAIPDFPLAFGQLVPPFDTPSIAIHFAHRLGAVAVTTMVVWSAARVLRTQSADPRLVRPALLACGLVLAQVMLGALIIWTQKAVLPTTAHVAVGAAVLATTLVLAMRAHRAAPPVTAAPAAVLGTERVPA